MKNNMTIAIVGVIILAAAGVVLAVNSGGNDEANANQVDGAFVSEMVPHHESAIEMAEIALEKGEHPEIIDLADDIIASQSSEIETLDTIHERLYGGPVGSEDHDDFGMSHSMMGMDMDLGKLESADEFDREFIDQMIPHHEGAVRMSRFQLSAGEDPETRDLAEAIIAAQSKEIKQMNQWRLAWYGAESPPSMPDHSGH